MSSPERQPDTTPDLANTLDLVQETAWRFWVRHRHIPYNSAERELFENVVTQMWTTMLSEIRQTQPGDTPTNGTSDRTKLALAVVSLLLGAGVPTFGAVQGQWNTAALAGGAFLLGVVLTALTPWGRK